MIRRPTGCFCIDPAKAKLAQIEFLNKNVDHANGIVLIDPVFQAFRKQRALPTTRALNEAPHPIPPQKQPESYSANQITKCVFTQAGSLVAATSIQPRGSFTPDNGHGCERLLRPPRPHA